MPGVKKPSRFVRSAISKHAGKNVRSFAPLSAEDLAGMKRYFDMAGVILLALDHKGRIVFINDKGARILGSRPSLMVGKNWFRDFLTEPQRSGLYREFKRAMWSKRRSTRDFFPDGTEEYVKTPKGLKTIIWHNSFLRDENGTVVGTFSSGEDVTGASELRERLRLVDQQFRGAFEYAAIGMAIVSLDGNFLRVNKALSKLVGYRSSELLKKSFQDITHPDDLKGDLKLLKDLTNGRISSYSLEKRYIHKRGHEIWVRISVSLAMDRSGKPLHYVGQIEDISERVRLGKEASEKSRLLQSVIDGIPDVIRIQKPGHEVIMYNKAGYEMLNLRKGEIAGRKCYEMIGRDGPCDICATKEAVKKKMPATVETFISQLGIWLECRSIPVFDSSGKIDIIVEVLRDITQSKKDQDEIRKSRDYLKTLFEVIPSAIYTVDMQRKITSWNNVAAKITGFDARDVIGKGCNTFAIEPCLHTCGLFDKNTPKPVLNRECTLKTKDGKIKTVLKNADEIHDGSGNVIGGVESFEDITERKEMEERMMSSVAELARSNKELENFAYSLSHDLQEPLRSVSGYLSLVEKRYADKLDSEGAGFVQVAVSGAKKMSRMIEDLLGYSRVQTRGKKFSSVNMTISLEKALAKLRTAIENSGAKIEYGRLPIVTADETQMVVLFQNIISNSIRYRSKYFPKIMVGSSENEREWVFAVADNGVGFDMKDSESIFRLFKRLNKYDNHPGTGVGLPIAKRIIDRHGGKIWAESKPGAGSTFYFTLPKKI